MMRVPKLPQKFTIRQRQDLRRYTRNLRESLAPFDLWPRDARAWARRDQIEALLAHIETGRIGATEDDPTAFMKVMEEVQEWQSREFDFIRTYPVLKVPTDWTR